MQHDVTASFDVAIIGAGSIGIAVAYYLVREHGIKHVVLIDSLEPMSLTSAQSGENYRNWWPHPVMTAFTDHSITLLEQIDRESDRRLNMTRGGYALVTRRAKPEDLIADLYRGYGAAPAGIRIRETAAGNYAPPQRSPWSAAPDGVDVLVNRELIAKTFPAYADDISTVIHIRRAGSISAQQLGQTMLEAIRAQGASLIKGKVAGISGSAPFLLEIQTADGTRQIRAEKLVNAAGPFLGEVAKLLGETLPVKCVFQQKIAFPDRAAAVPRDMPFSIDLDAQTLRWSDEERTLLASDPLTKRYVEPMNGGIHCRPDGAVDGTWIKLGWAFNEQATNPAAEDPIDPQFPDTVLRGASRLNPKLAAYIGRLPRGARHYGGYYTMTEENWPLIGKTPTPGAFVAGALSGFGSMAACASGALCAAWVTDAAVPDYAHALTLERYADQALMTELAALSKGSL